jgi:ABC transporter substrate binding protein
LGGRSRRAHSRFGGWQCSWEVKTAIRILKLALEHFERRFGKWGGQRAATSRIDYRWAAADPDRVRAYAAELVGLTPDVILAHAPAALKELQLEARTVPIVFVMVPVPVAREVVASFARPGGNITVVGPDFVRIEFVIDAHAHDMVRDTGIEVDSNGAPRSTLFPFRNSREADQ